MRKTIRLDDIKVKRLQDRLNEDDISKVVDFALSWTNHHIDFVTNTLISPEWDVIFQKKRKTMELKRMIYQ